MKKLLILILIIMFFGCNKYIYVDDVQKGENLDKATEITVNEFFQKRMENKLRKINVGNWDILYQNSEFVFIGKPRLKNLFSQKRIIDTLCKTNIEKLNAELSGYKDLEGFIIRQKIYTLIQEYKKTNNQNYEFYLNDNFTSKLTDVGLETIVTISYQTNKKEKYSVIFDKNSLELIQISKDTSSNYVKYYPFDGAYIDLDSLKRLEIDGILALDFKSASIYSFRFYAPNDWINNYYQSAEYKNCLFIIETNKSIKITDKLTKEEILIPNNESGINQDNTVGNHFLVATNTGVIEVKKLEGENGYKLYKYDETGKQLFKLEFEHTEIKIEGNTHYSNPYLTYFTCTNDYMVFKSYNSKIEKTLLIDLINGKITTYNYTFNGVIRTDNEDNIPGFIEINNNGDGFKTLILNQTWNAKIENLGSNTAETLVKDNILVVSFYHSISTGSSLYAYDLTTGKFLWQADVKQLLVDHSEYYNTVLLSSYNDLVIMEGIEAYGKYVQIFNISTGERVYSSF